MFLKKKKTAKIPESKIILGMVMLEDDNSFKLESFIDDFKHNYAVEIHELSGANSAAALTIDGETVAIGHMPVPIPSGDIEETAKYAYNWQTVLEETKNHRSHLVVSVMHGGQDQIKRFKLFTQVLCVLLRTTNAIGIYLGNQSLLIPKNDFLNEAELMSEEYLPLNLWIYFGLRISTNGNSVYTYGLKEFHKNEMEVLDSSKDIEEIRSLLFNISHYVLDRDIVVNNGETCGVSKDERIKITISKGKLVEGDTFKLEYQ